MILWNKYELWVSWWASKTISHSKTLVFCNWWNICDLFWWNFDDLCLKNLNKNTFLWPDFLFSHKNQNGKYIPCFRPVCVWGGGLCILTYPLFPQRSDFEIDFSFVRYRGGQPPALAATREATEWMVSYWRDLQKLTRWHDDEFDDVVMILGLEFPHLVASLLPDKCHFWNCAVGVI